MRSLKNHVLFDMNDRLKRLRKCKNELKEVFNITFENDNFANIKWHSTETSENVIVIEEEDFSSEFQTSVGLNIENEETINDSEKIKGAPMSISEHKPEFRIQKLQEMMDGRLEIRFASLYKFNCTFKK